LVAVLTGSTSWPTGWSGWLEAGCLALSLVCFRSAVPPRTPPPAIFTPPLSPALWRRQTALLMFVQLQRQNPIKEIMFTYKNA